jgi:hypothetical protein
MLPDLLVIFLVFVTIQSIRTKKVKKRFYGGFPHVPLAGLRPHPHLNNYFCFIAMHPLFGRKVWLIIRLLGKNAY